MQVASAISKRWSGPSNQQYILGEKYRSLLKPLRGAMRHACPSLAWKEIWGRVEWDDGADVASDCGIPLIPSHKTVPG